MPVPILNIGLWPNVGNLLHNYHTRGLYCHISYHPPSIQQCHLSARGDIQIWPGRKAKGAVDLVMSARYLNSKVGFYRLVVEALIIGIGTNTSHNMKYQH